MPFDDGHGTVGAITLRSIYRTPHPDSYLVARFVLTIDEGTGMATPAAFSVRSPEGSTYLSEPGVGKRFHQPRITAGQSVRGDVAFDAPEGELFIDYRVSGPPLATFQIVA